MHAVHIRCRNAAVQVGVNVLQIFRPAVVDITGDVQVVIVYVFYFVVRHKAGVFRVGCIGIDKGGDDFMDILLTQAVLVAVFDKALTRINHKKAFTLRSIFFVNNDNTGRNTRAEKQIWRQTDDTFDKTLIDNFFTNGSFRIAAKQYTMWQNNCRFAVRFQGLYHMQQPGKIAIFLRRYSKFSIAVSSINVGDADAIHPRLIRKWRIDHDIIKTSE